MRDLSLRTGHQPTDGLPHRVGLVAGRRSACSDAGAATRAGRRAARSTSAAVIGCPGCAADDAREVDTELGRAPACVRRRRDALVVAARDRRGRRQRSWSRWGWGRRWRGGKWRGEVAPRRWRRGRWRRGRWRGRFRCRGRRGGRCRSGVDDGRERRADLEHVVAFGHEQLADHAVVEDLDLDVGLVGLHHRDEVAAVHRVAGMHEPLEEPALGHVGAERRHAEDSRLRHGRPPAARRPTTALTVGSAASSRCFAYGIGTSALHTRSTGASRS